MLRVSDVMQRAHPVSDRDTPLREAGRDMVEARLELVPIVDEKGALIGVVTERTLARRYIRESRETSILEAPTFVDAVVQVLDGELVVGENRQLKGRVWVHSMDVNSPSGIAPGDIVVTGNRGDAQRLAINHDADLLVDLQRCTARSGGGRACLGAPRGDHRLTARHLRFGANDFARGAVSRIHGERPSDCAGRLPGGRYRRADKGDPLRRGRRHRLEPKAGGAADAFRLSGTATAARNPRRPCGAGTKRGRYRAGRDRGDPRPSPRRFDRDAGPRHGHL